MAAEQATPEQIDAMQEAIDELASAKTLDKQIEADTRFHNALAIASGNPLFPVMLSSIAPLLDESRKLTISNMGADRAIEGHVVVYEAVRDHDSQAARDAMRRHLDMAEEDLETKEETS